MPSHRFGLSGCLAVSEETANDRSAGNPLVVPMLRRLHYHLMKDEVCDSEEPAVMTVVLAPNAVSHLVRNCRHLFTASCSHHTL